jgi:hypothetical protein
MEGEQMVLDLIVQPAQSQVREPVEDPMYACQPGRRSFRQIEAHLPVADQPAPAKHRSGESTSRDGVR